MNTTLAEIQGYVWRRLGIRKLIAGRERVDELVEVALANWDQEALSNAKDKAEIDIVATGMVIGIKRTHEMLGQYDGKQEYGFVWIILFQALASAIVQILIKWWFESSENRLKIWAVRKELAG